MRYMEESLALSSRKIDDGPYLYVCKEKDCGALVKAGIRLSARHRVRHRRGLILVDCDEVEGYQSSALFAAMRRSAARHEALSRS